MRIPWTSYFDNECTNIACSSIVCVIAIGGSIVRIGVSVGVMVIGTISMISTCTTLYTTRDITTDIMTIITITACLYNFISLSIYIRCR
jgi:hypothetical protein